ncbi:MAG: hypothetical protein R3B09_12825 [Nannocystaceae bacterium]
MTAWSPWAGRSRAPLRIGIAALVGVDLLVLGWLCAHIEAGERSREAAPAWLLGLGGEVGPALVLTVLGLVGVAGVITRRRPILSGALALAACGALCELHAALVGGPMRIFFFAGVMLLGWLIGQVVHRALHGRPRGAEDERLAELGATAALAANYVNAAISKLVAGVAGWADAHHLQAIVLDHHHLGDPGLLGRYAAAVIESPTLALTLSLATLVIQLGAAALVLGARARRLSALLLLGFHANVLALTHIFFAQAMVLLVLVSAPWWWRRPAGDDEPTAPPIAGARRRVGVLVALALALGVAAWTAPLRVYTRGAHGGGAGEGDARPELPADVLALLGGLEVGASLGGWTIEAIEARPGSLRLVLARGAERGTVEVTRRGARPFDPPARTDRYDLFYGAAGGPTPDAAAIEPALAALRAGIAARESAIETPAGW